MTGYNKRIGKLAKPTSGTKTLSQLFGLFIAVHFIAAEYYSFRAQQDVKVVSTAEEYIICNY